MNSILAKQAAMRERQNTPHKRCTACQERKPLTAFSQNTKRDGQKAPRSICKACDNAKQTVYRAKQKAERAAYQAAKASTLTCKASDGTSAIESNPLPSASGSGPSASPRPAVVVSENVIRCGCPKRLICRRCNSVIDGKYCRFCRLPVETLETHEPDCSTLHLFNQHTPAFAQKADAEAKYHGSRYGY